MKTDSPTAAHASGEPEVYPQAHREQYERPQLRVLGTLATRTFGNAGFGGDGQAGSLS